MNKRYKTLYPRSKKRKRFIIFICLIIITFSYEAKEWVSRRNTMFEMNDPIIVGFPLRGEWLSPNTPGSKIPSHGTNQLGTRYAYDFIQVDWNRTGNPAYCVSLIQYLFWVFN